MNEPINRAIFQSIRDACATTGLSMYYLRQGCKSGVVPHVRSGQKFLINVPELLRNLGEESRRGKAS